MFAKLVQHYLKECHTNAVAIQSGSQERSKKYNENKRQRAPNEVW